MRGRRSGQTVSAPVDSPANQPIVVQPNAVFRKAGLMAVSGMPASGINREVRLGRLRVGRRGGKLYSLGCWVLEWLQAGELKSPKPKPVRSPNDEQ